MKIFELSHDDFQFPKSLKQIFDCPGKIYCAGNLDVFDRAAVAIVGTRKATPYGESQAYEMAKQLSMRGVCIVSGLAYGIDAAAHRGAMEGCGGTIAVVAQGLPEIRPAHHMGLAQQIIENGGLIVSENENGHPTLKHEYLVRNRIISGLSRGVLVIEAASRSGAINTAYHALEQNRELMAIPGRLNDEMSAGTNRLIADGAFLVQSASEVAELIGIPWAEQLKIQLYGLQKRVFEILKANPMTASELAERFDGSLKELYATLGELELQGIIMRTRDMRYSTCAL